MYQGFLFSGVLLCIAMAWLIYQDLGRPGYSLREYWLGCSVLWRSSRAAGFGALWQRMVILMVLKILILETAQDSTLSCISLMKWSIQHGVFQSCCVYQTGSWTGSRTGIFKNKSWGFMSGVWNPTLIPQFKWSHGQSLFWPALIPFCPFLVQTWEALSSPSWMVLL